MSAELIRQMDWPFFFNLTLSIDPVMFDLPRHWAYRRAYAGSVEGGVGVLGASGGSFLVSLLSPARTYCGWAG